MNDAALVLPNQTWTRLGDKVLGPMGSKRRLRVGRSMLAGMVYLLILMLRWGGVAAGVVPVHAAAITAVFDLAGVAVFYVLLRTGWSERLRDPSMTLPQIFYALASVVLAYALIEVSRGAALLLLCQILAFGMYRLTPLQILMSGLTAVCMLVATLAFMSYNQASDFDVRQESLNIVLSAVILPVLGFIGKQVSELRRRQIKQGKELAAALDQLQELATRDTLTSLINRRHMLDVLTEERKRFVRTGRPFCVAILDLDHFKRVNDSWGHQAGDCVLAGFAKSGLDVLRKSDVLCRWGGEEFLLLMPETTRDEAVIALGRIREHLNVHDWSNTLPGEQRVTFSSGVAQYALGEPLEAVLERADRALYAAKAGGRNLTVAA